MRAGTLTLVTPPAALPISTAEAAEHLRLDEPQEDVLTTLIGAATQYLDGWTGILGRALITQTWDLRLDRFPSGPAPIVIDVPPLQSITSVKYLDPDGAEQTWPNTEYVVDLARAQVVPAFEKAYPPTRGTPNAVTVRFVAGYAPVDLPAADRLLVLWLTAHWHEHREPVVLGSGAPAPVPAHLERLIDARRIWRVA